MTGFGTKALLWIPHRTVPKLTPRPLRGGEIGRQNLDFNPKFLRRGGSSTPKFYTVGKLSQSSIKPVNLVFLVREIRKCLRRR